MRLHEFMLRSIIINPDLTLTHELQRAIAEVGSAAVARTLDRYMPQVELARILRAHAPQIVFVGIQSLDLCMATAAQVEQVLPGCQVVAIGESCDANTLITVMRAGIREFLAMPFERRTVWECIQRASQNLLSRPMAVQATELVYAFLPSKPGVGTTTIALNGAIAAQNEAGVLLMDYDLNCGMLRFLLKLDSTHSILEALEHASSMDEQLWPQLVSKAHGIDILHGGRSRPDLRIDGLQIQHLMEFARRNYRVVCADLSGNLERYSLEVMHDAKQVFLVCTPEVASLHLAREKMQYLQSLELGDRVQVLLNRQTKKSEVHPEHVEELVGAPVAMTFSNDYARVTAAIRDGAVIDPKSELGKQFASFGQLLSTRKVAAEPKRRKFVEYFTLTPAKFSFEGRR